MQASAILKSKGASVATIRRDATVAAAVAELACHDIGALVVSSDGRQSEGIISERDVTRALDKFGGEILSRPVGTIISSWVRTVSPDEDVESLAAIMTEYRLRHIPVLQDGVLAGIVSIGDVVKSRVEELNRTGTRCSNIYTLDRIGSLAGRQAGDDESLRSVRPKEPNHGLSAYAYRCVQAPEGQLFELSNHCARGTPHQR